MINAGVFAQNLGAPQGVAAAVQKASAKTGVDFSYLLTQAKVESGFKTDAKASTSSATGLFQFIEQTWLRQVDQNGAAHGKADWADAITQGKDGRFRVSDPALRQTILNGRKDAEFSSAMAAELAADNKSVLERKIDRDVNATDLYMAHFLGAGGASTFLSAMQDNPLQTASVLFPDASRANRNVFFDGSRPRSLAEVYDKFSAKFDNDAPVQTAAATGPRIEMRIEKAEPKQMARADILDLLDTPATPYTGHVTPFRTQYVQTVSPIQTMIGNDLLSGSLLALIGGTADTHRPGGFGLSRDKDSDTQDRTLRALSSL